MTQRMPFPARPARPSARSSARSRLFRLAPVSVALALALQAGAARAVDAFQLKDIRVEGLQRTDAGTVFAALPFRIGDTYTDEKGAAALRALFATGLFKDVRIDIDGGVAVVIVEERAVIANIDFVGMKEFEKDALTKSLKEFGIGEGLPFDKALADRAEQEIKRQYLTRSLYGAEIVTTVTPQERNRVNVTFTVTEGSAAKIREIRIVGNHVFSEGTLKSLFELNDGGWLNFYLKGDRYSRAKLNADLETLRAYYQNRGYLEFEVDSTQVAISPDKQDITITINVKEGQPYTVTAVRLEGEYLGKEDEFKALVRIRPGQPYRAESIAETTRSFTDRFGTFGYAFAKVDSRPEIDRATGQVVVVLTSDPQRRVYVRRISVVGNTRTRDEVVRREFRQFESSWYDGRKIKLSRDRVDRLGYFSEVNVDSTEVPGTQDQVDLTITIKEKPTGAISVGAGFSSADKLSLTASIKQENIFGSGNYLGLEVNTSKYNQTLVVSTVDPYFTVDGISRAIDVYYRTTKPINSQGEEYKLVTPGVSVRFGVPFSEFDTVFFGIGAERTEISGTTQLPEQLLPLSPGIRRDQRLDPAHRRLVARQPRQRPGADGRPLPALQPRRRSDRRCHLHAAQRAGAAVRAHHARLHVRRQCRVRLRPRPQRPALSDLQELLRRRPRHGARFRPGHARPGRRDGCVHRRQQALQHEQRALSSGAGRQPRPHAADLRLRRRRQRLGRERKHDAQQPARVRRRRHQLDFAGRPAEAQLRRADPQEAGR